MNGCDIDLDLLEAEMVRNSPFVPATSRGKTGESPSWPKDTQKVYHHKIPHDTFLIFFVLR